MGIREREKVTVRGKVRGKGNVGIVGNGAQTVRVQEPTDKKVKGKGTGSREHGERI